MLWLFLGVAMGGQTGDVVVCPDGEPVRPIEKKKVCEKPFTLFARDLSVKVKARAQALDSELSASSNVVEVSGDVAKALRTQGAALCVGMMTAPCSVKDDYARIVNRMPKVLVELQRAKSLDDIAGALQEAEELAGAVEDSDESEESGAITGTWRVRFEPQSGMRCRDPFEQTLVVRENEDPWRVSIEATESGSDQLDLVALKRGDEWQVEWSRTGAGWGVLRLVGGELRGHHDLFQGGLITDCRGVYAVRGVASR